MKPVQPDMPPLPVECSWHDLFSSLHIAGSRLVNIPTEPLQNVGLCDPLVPMDVMIHGHGVSSVGCPFSGKRPHQARILRLAI